MYFSHVSLQATELENKQLSPISLINSEREHDRARVLFPGQQQPINEEQVQSVYTKKLRLAGRAVQPISIPDGWLPPSMIIQHHNQATGRLF